MMSLYEIAEAIEKECDRAQDLIDEVYKTVVKAAEAEVDFKSEFARSRITIRDDAANRGAKMTMDQVEDHATLETVTERRAHLLAGGTLTAVREALRVSQARLDAYRTLAATFRNGGG